MCILINCRSVRFDVITHYHCQALFVILPGSNFTIINKTNFIFLITQGTKFFSTNKSIKLKHCRHRPSIRPSRIPSQYQIMEKAINDTKSKRSKLKAKIEVLATQLSRPRLTSDRHKKYYDDLLEAYDDFLLIHHNFCGLVHDEKYASHRTVAGLDLNSYLAAVNISYETAEKSYIDTVLLNYIHDGELAITKAQCILSQVDTISPNQHSVLCKQAKDQRVICQSIYDFVFTNASDNAILGKLDKTMSD